MGLAGQASNVRKWAFAARQLAASASPIANVAWWLAAVGMVRVSSYHRGMAIAENHPPHSLGLGGDGDEIAAIADVERRFEVNLDYSDARSWTTAGDVYAALQRALPAEQVAAPDTWARFAEAILMETGVDPSRVQPETLLLGQHRFDRRLLLVTAALLGLAFAVARHW